MFPIRDDIPAERFPIVNYMMIAICSLVFLLQAAQGPASTLVERYGMIPARVAHPDKPIETFHYVAVQTPEGQGYVKEKRLAEPSSVPAWLTLLTCTFLHGGWMHVIGNMWFLHIFGDNVEDRMGHLGYAIFYIACGVAASMAHMITGPESTIPTIGASGAVAGVMGAYMLLYPGAKVLAVIPIFIILQMIVLPAPVFLGIWFLLQFFQGTFAIASTESSGVAWWAHIGGFAVGAAVAWGLNQSHLTNPAVKARREYANRGAYRIYPRRR